LKSFEYHVGGQPVRVIVEGVPSAQGRTQVEKAAWFARHADRYRRGLVLAPRGHADMMSVLLTEPSSPRAHAGLLFLDGGGYPHLAIPGVMAATRAAVEHELIFARASDGDPTRSLIFDTPSGVVVARTDASDPAPKRVIVDEVASFVQAAGLSVALSSRTVPVDIAFSGDFYALVDGEAAGVVLDESHVAELRRIGRAVCAAVNRAATMAHPADPAAQGVAGVVFTAPARDASAVLRMVLVSAAGCVDWSPGGTGAPAVMAVLDAMGLFADGNEFTHEGLSGTQALCRRLRSDAVGDRVELIADVHGEVWPTGEQTWLLDHDDPFVQGLPVAAGAPR